MSRIVLAGYSISFVWKESESLVVTSSRMGFRRGNCTDWTIMEAKCSEIKWRARCDLKEAESTIYVALNPLGICLNS